NAMKSANLMWMDPSPQITTKCFSQPLLNDAPRVLIDNLSRYLVQSHPTSSAGTSVAASKAIKVIVEPAGPAPGKTVLDNMKAKTDAIKIKPNEKIANRHPLRRRRSSSTKTSAICMNRNDSNELPVVAQQRHSTSSLC